jgi:hypothetical protein
MFQNVQTYEYEHHMPATLQTKRGRDNLPVAEELFAGPAANCAVVHTLEDVDDIARQVT